MPSRLLGLSVQHGRAAHSAVRSSDRFAKRAVAERVRPRRYRCAESAVSGARAQPRDRSPPAETPPRPLPWTKGAPSPYQRRRPASNKPAAAAAGRAAAACGSRPAPLRPYLRASLGLCDPLLLLGCPSGRAVVLPRFHLGRGAAAPSRKGKLEHIACAGTRWGGEKQQRRPHSAPVVACGEHRLVCACACRGAACAHVYTRAAPMRIHRILPLPPPHPVYPPPPPPQPPNERLTHLHLAK